jgi:hypothetical protein
MARREFELDGGMPGALMARGFEIAGFTFAAAESLRVTENRMAKRGFHLRAQTRIFIRAKRSSMVIL